MVLEIKLLSLNESQCEHPHCVALQPSLEGAAALQGMSSHSVSVGQGARGVSRGLGEHWLLVHGSSNPAHSKHCLLCSLVSRLRKENVDGL